MKEKILVIDGDTEFADLAQAKLRDAGYEVIAADNGIAGLHRAYTSRPDLVMLEANIPQLDGWGVCDRIRQMSDVALMMVTAKAQKSDRLRGFDLGVDDYMSKPVDFVELIARVRAVLRRTVRNTVDEPTTFSGSGIDVDWRSHRVCVRGEIVKLSPTEFKLLSCLIRNRGWIVPHEQLLERTWGPNHFADASFTKLYVRYLRKKIEKDPQRPELILTERGVGYRFAVQN